jgi:soluble lytic murein transglycosylase
MLSFLIRCFAVFLCSGLLLSYSPLSLAASLSPSPDKTDQVLIDMASAFSHNDRKKLSQLLPQAKGHMLEPWAAYWELRVRLGDASDNEVKEFLSKYAGTYQEDRMRYDWMLVLAQRQEWTQFEREFELYRMHDDKEVECYASWLSSSHKKFEGTAAQEEFIRQTWLSMKNSDEGCTYAFEQLLLAKRVNPLDAWRKARTMVEINRKPPARDALHMVSGQSMAKLDELMSNPTRFLQQRATSLGKESAEWMTLALVKLAATDQAAAIKQINNNKAVKLLNTEQLQWVWAVIGRQSAMDFDNKAVDYFELSGSSQGLTDDLLAWKVRAALRAEGKSRWPMVEAAINAMSPAAQKDPAWVYWRARALIARQPTSTTAMPQALMALQSIAGTQGFYEQLALEELGQKISAPPRPAAPTAAEMEAAKANPGLQRALHAIRLGIRAEGTREWNYTAGLVDAQGKRGRMTDREKSAVAQWACELEIWDRCISSSERIQQFDVNHRYPMPFRDEVLTRTKDINLEAAFVYGLIRQESRFIINAKSSVGASGLMQVMPRTGKWTAKKLGMKNFQADQLNQRETNIAIGTGYLKLILDNFQGSMPMAAAAYNAGPSRPRKWRNGPQLEGAIWAECIPFNETRDYVKKVMSNTTMYAAVISGEPQSLKARLGKVAPRDKNEAPEDNDLP